MKMTELLVQVKYQDEAIPTEESCYTLCDLDCQFFSAVSKTIFLRAQQSATAASAWHPRCSMFSAAGGAEKKTSKPVCTKSGCSMNTRTSRRLCSRTAAAAAAFISSSQQNVNCIHNVYTLHLNCLTYCLHLVPLTGANSTHKIGRACHDASPPKKKKNLHDC